MAGSSSRPATLIPFGLSLLGSSLLPRSSFLCQPLFSFFAAIAFSRFAGMPRSLPACFRIAESDLAGKALNGMMGAIYEALSSGYSVTLIGFGTFSVSERAARTGRNPSTGKKIKIATKKVAKFKPGKTLADAVNYPVEVT